MIVVNNQTIKAWRRHDPICPELRNLRKSDTDLDTEGASRILSSHV